jgi:small subunit ribosomal protein S21
MAGPINVEVRLRERETTDKLIRRFIKKCKKEKIIEEYRAKAFYEKPSMIKKRKKLRRKKIAQELQAERNKQTN